MEFTSIIENYVVKVSPVIRGDQMLIHLASTSDSKSTTPYEDARQLKANARTVFARAGIPVVVVICDRLLAKVRSGSGSGPKGRVMPNDDMLPPDVQAIVAAEDAARAQQVWADYRFQCLQDPISETEEKPKDCSNAQSRAVQTVISIAKAIGNRRRKIEARQAA
ncbi:MAG: hypothetical protein QM627_05155 [Luteolibacter sp.]